MFPQTRTFALAILANACADSSSELSATQSTGMPGEVTSSTGMPDVTSLDEPTSTTSSSTTSSTSSSTTSSSSTGSVALCGDAVRTPGEVCFHEPFVAGIGATVIPLATADINGDGFQDLVVGGIDNQWRPLYGTGSTLEPGPSVFSDGAVIAIKAADLDGDGLSEVVIVKQTASPSFIDTYSQIQGKFEITSSMMLSGPSGDISLNDLDRDGALDVVFVNYNTGTVLAARGNGTGSFVAWKEIEVGPRPRSVAVDDVDGDGALDVAVSLESCQGEFNDPGAFCDPSTTGFIRGFGEDNPTVSILPTGPRYNSRVFFTDTDLNGQKDLVAVTTDCGFMGLDYTCKEPGRFALFQSTGLGMFDEPKLIEIERIAVDGVEADIDGDGFPDLAIAHYGPDGAAPAGRISIFRNLSLIHI